MAALYCTQDALSCGLRLQDGQLRARAAHAVPPTRFQPCGACASAASGPREGRVALLFLHVAVTIFPHQPHAHLTRDFYGCVVFLCTDTCSLIYMLAPLFLAHR